MSNVFDRSGGSAAFLVDGAPQIVPEPTELTAQTDGFVLVMNQDGAVVRVRVTNPSGELVLDETNDWSTETSPTSWEQNVRGLIVFDPETREEIVVFPNDEMERAFREQNQQNEDLYADYRPDQWLLATVDGERWLVHDVDDGDAIDGPEPIGSTAVAINGTTVLANLNDEWVSFDLS